MENNSTENNNVDISTINKKKNHSIIILICLIIFAFIIGKKVYSYNYRSIDNNNNSQKVNDYLVKYMKDKYDADVTLLLQKEDLIYICSFRMVDGSCMDSAENNDIYEYKFSGVDSDNNQFVISYTNSYIGRSKKYKAKIVDNYKLYYESNKLEKVISKYSNNVDIYANVHDGATVYNTSTGIEEIADNYLIVRIYLNKIDASSIVKIIEETENFDSVSNVIITSDDEVYDEILLSNKSYSSSYRLFQEEGFYQPNILSNKFEYTYVKPIGDNDSYFLSDFKNFKFENDRSYYSIIYYGEKYHIYKKSK